MLVGMDAWETVKLADVAYVLNRPDFNRLEHVRFEILRRGSTFYGFLPVTAKTARRP